jgi:hypothetical protein
MRANNTFLGGINQDVSKHLLDNTKMVDSFQCEILNRAGENFALTTANGNSEAFSISAGFTLKAARDYNGVIYIVSTNATSGQMEFGSYKSPNVSPTEAGVPANNVYAAFKNLDSGSDMRVSFSDLSITSDIDFLDIVLQQDYDDSVNIIVSSADISPILVNSGFSYRNKTFYSTERDPYVSEDLFAQVKLIIDSSTALDIEFGAITPGGSLKPGNYVYYFSYLTQDLNESEIVNQSSICQVSFGEGEDIKGGIDTDNAGKRVRLSLTNVDQTFAYIQPYFTYTSGDNTRVKQTVKFNTPIAATSSTMQFTHNGFEQVTEVPTSEIGVDFANIKSASTIAENQGYLFMANISEKDRKEQVLSDWMKTIKVRSGITGDLPLDFYKDPKNVYDKLGFFSEETYLIYAVAKYKSGGYSPAFPTEGYDYSTESSNTDGLIRFPNLWNQNHFDARSIRVKHLSVTFPQTTTAISEEISEVFLVRPERQNSVLVGQGLVLPVTKVPGSDLETDLTLSAEFYDVDDTPGKYVPTVEGQFDVYNGIEDENGTNTYTATVDGVKRGDMFISMGKTYRSTNLQDAKKWALYTSELLSNSPNAVAKISQASKISLIGTMQAVGKDAAINFVHDGGARIPLNIEYATRFEVSDIDIIANALTTIPIDKLSYIGENTRSTGSPLVSRVGMDLNREGNGKWRSRILLSYMPYLGLELDSDLFTYSADNPLGYEERHTNPAFLGSGAVDVNSVGYDGMLGKTRPIGAMVNIYSGDQLALADYYTNADSLAFNQIGKRFLISTLPSAAQEIYGGDCYIAESYYTLNHSPYKDPIELDPTENRNNDCGLIVSFAAESESNLNLRHTYNENASDLEETDFYPFNKNYREKRYADSNRVSPGYNYDETDVSFFPNPSILPDVKSNFFTRIFHSAKHIPNSFTNGYRFFTNGFQDYDTSMGKITKLFGYGGNLVIIFEYGVGVTPINQRIQTASDIAGGIFIEPSGVLSTQMGVMSYSVGSQHPYSIIKTAHFIYGIDAEKGKIFKINPDNLEEISEGIIASKIKTTTNPRTGYDPIKKLVYFISDEWCYVYSELLGKFITRSDGSGTAYAQLPGIGMYGFIDNRAFLFDDSDTIYDGAYKPFVEFVINENFTIAKTFDYVNLYSNNVSPESIEFSTLNFDGTINQKCVITQGIDFYTEDDTILYRDKKFVAQVPSVTEGDSKNLDMGLDTGFENRMRDKYVIVKVVYSNLDFELNLVGTEYRLSKS